MAQTPEHAGKVHRGIELDADADAAIRAIARDEIDKRLHELHLAPIDLLADKPGS